jgi:DNA mismatch repair protein MutS
MDDPPPFHSILFFDGAHPDAESERRGEPQCFHDLNLDQIVAAVTAGREPYELQSLFHAPLQSVAAVHYRHEVFRDLEDGVLRARVTSFGQSMQIVRERLAQSEKAHYPLRQQRWFLDAVSVYCEAVVRLHADLSATQVQSRGFCALRDFLGAYLRAEGFRSLRDEARRIAEALAAIGYELYIDGARIEVRRDEGEPDYGAEVSKTFAKFEQPGATEYRFRFHEYRGMNHVEAAILERIALLFPTTFAALAAFWDRDRNGTFDPTIRRFDREAQFYLACLEHKARLELSGLAFCYPQVDDRSKVVWGEGVFDCALAGRLVAEHKAVVTNDFRLEGAERILVISGANQGGKTTFARAFGQLHYLAALGCPVPARKARLLLFDELYTHFEREEAVESLRGKLEDELLRMSRILDAVTPRSILIMNESFGSTTLEDALYLGKAVLRRIIDRDLLCVCVTFVEELASLDRATVSTASQVDPADPAVRTFRVVRQAAEGLAHALAIARKHGLRYEEIRARLAARSAPREHFPGTGARTAQ